MKRFITLFLILLMATTAHARRYGNAEFVGTVELPNSITLPATCTVGEIYIDTDATSGKQIYSCESADTWILQGGGHTDLTEFVDQTNWRVFYSDGSGDVTELTLGADGSYLRSNGATSAPTFSTPAGGGDVLKVGTPVNDQVSIWTGDGTVEGDADLTFDGTILTSAGFAGPLTGAVTGNADTATALVANGANCAAGSYALGVDAGGAVESCTAVTSESSTAGRSLTLAGVDISADAELYTGQAGRIAFLDPVDTDDYFFGEISVAQTATGIYCKTLVGTVTLDVTIAGSDINGTDITCTTSGVLDSALAGDTTLAVGEELKLEITSVASAPTYLMVIVNSTKDD